MNKLQRLFKRKIKGKELENLALAFNVDLDWNFKTYYGWTTTKRYAILEAIPQKNFLKLEAYFYSNKGHIKNFETNEKIYRSEIYFKKTLKIPCSKLNKLNSKEKLKC